MIGASCTSKAHVAVGGSPGTGDTATSSTTQAPGATTSTVRARAGTATTARRSPATVQRSATPTTSGSGGSAAPADDVIGRGPTGSFARSVLQPRPYASVRFELLAQSGATPANGVISHTTNLIQQYSGKTVNATVGRELPGAATEWTFDVLTSYGDTYGTANTGSGEAVVHLLYVHGELKGKPDVLGVAFRGDLLVVFPDRVRAYATPTVPRSAIEKTTVTHETGHMLGLVDLVLHEKRGDPQDPSGCMCHSSNTASVMYYAVDSSLVTSIFNGPPPTEFDDADAADLQKIHNGA